MTQTPWSMHRSVLQTCCIVRELGWHTPLFEPQEGSLCYVEAVIIGLISIMLGVACVGTCIVPNS